jgi:N-methylhydantoinase B
VFEEGLIIPPAKLYRAGEPNEDLFNLIRANVRLPDIVVGDLRAQLACNHVGATRLLELLEDHGLEDLSAVGDEIIERTARALRNAIGTIKPGTYTHEIFVDRASSSDANVAPLRIAVERGG